jgi:hypothetical protein
LWLSISVLAYAAEVRVGILARVKHRKHPKIWAVRADLVSRVLNAHDLIIAEEALRRAIIETVATEVQNEQRVCEDSNASNLAHLLIELLFGRFMHPRPAILRQLQGVFEKALHSLSIDLGLLVQVFGCVARPGKAEPDHLSDANTATILRGHNNRVTSVDVLFILHHLE